MDGWQQSYEGQWLGLSYLLLDHGYPFHGAIQDALELGEFRLVLTLLSKINPSENHVLQRLDDSQRNLPPGEILLGVNETPKQCLMNLDVLP